MSVESLPGGVLRFSTFMRVNENDISNLSGVQPFRSQQEETAAFADPRYKNDPAYRQEVTRRVAATHPEVVTNQV